MTVAQTQCVLRVALVSMENLLRRQNNICLGRRYIPETLGSPAHYHGCVSNIFYNRLQETSHDTPGAI